MSDNKVYAKDYRLYILFLQIAAVAVILLAALIIRFFGGNFYNKLSVIYHEKFDEVTNTADVLDPKNPKEDFEGQEREKNDNTENNISKETETDNKETAVDEKSETISVSSGVNTLAWPLNGKVVSPYGFRNDPFTNEYKMHNGIDIAAATGTDISASFSGEVLKTAYSQTYGNYVIISHSESLSTLYAHCSKIYVKEGQSVQKGDVIAAVGSTGRSTGPHLHFEVRIADKKIDPNLLLHKRVEA